MAEQHQREVWLRGPLPNVPALLQPVAHALLQAKEEVNRLMADFPEIYLWIQPVGMASPGFHLQHMAGVIDRLFTYAQAEPLTQHQMDFLHGEGKAPQNQDSVAALLDGFAKRVDEAVEKLSAVDEATLTEVRGVGRAQIPSTVIGLYVHAAEHVMRHLGQLLVTVRMLKGG
ncbi:DinB family protein [Mucilaginibacter calamicampi]|uniref:DinB family protein n=1 Tax=Mucilaginibacter calamicampi TaxID=1302352 RepID=A0ABW2YRD0_9SPHI